MFVELDGKIHNRSAFDCGKPYFNDFLQKTAGQAASRYNSKTFVLIDEADPATIIGYHTTLIRFLDVSNFPEAKKLKNNKIPMLLLAMLGVDSRFHGKGYGTDLVMDVLVRALLISQNTALYGVELDAYDEALEPYYTSLGFSRLLDHPRHFYMTIGTIKSIVSPS